MSGGETGRSIRTEVCFQQVFTGIVVVYTTEIRKHIQFAGKTFVGLGSRSTGIHIIQFVIREVFAVFLIVTHIIFLGMISQHHFQTVITECLVIVQQSIEIIS